MLGVCWVVLKVWRGVREVEGVAEKVERGWRCTEYCFLHWFCKGFAIGVGVSGAVGWRGKNVWMAWEARVVATFFDEWVWRRMAEGWRQWQGCKMLVKNSTASTWGVLGASNSLQKTVQGALGGFLSVTSDVLGLQNSLEFLGTSQGLPVVPGILRDSLRPPLAAKKPWNFQGLPK